jgi:hypothetical protein
MTLAARTQALLMLVEQERARQCAALIGEAEAAAQAQRSSSRAEARQRVHEAFAEERARCAAGTASARAELRTRQRLHAQHHLEALLALAWQLLPEQLAARWRDAATRSAWVQAALADARSALAAGGWQVSHAPGLTADEAPPGLAECRCDETLSAGLRIAAAGNVLDATLEGLLTDRSEIGGRLVGLLQTSSATHPAATAR